MNIKCENDIFLSLYKDRYCLIRAGNILQCPRTCKLCSSLCVFFEIKKELNAEDIGYTINLHCNTISMKQVKLINYIEGNNNEHQW